MLLIKHLNQKFEWRPRAPDVSTFQPILPHAFGFCIHIEEKEKQIMKKAHNPTYSARQKQEDHKFRVQVLLQL